MKPATLTELESAANVLSKQVGLFTRSDLAQLVAAGRAKASGRKVTGEQVPIEDDTFASLVQKLSLWQITLPDRDTSFYAFIGEEAFAAGRDVNSLLFALSALRVSWMDSGNETAH